MWLFHHVMKAALWQLKVAELPFTTTNGEPEPMSPRTRAAGNVALAALTLAGVGALTGDADSTKCIGLVAAFFAPVIAIIWNLGSRHFRSHWKLFLVGWLPPGLWTVVVDCIGQQQDVWYFPPRYLSGIATFDGWLKLDIAAVYMVSTFAVTATGAIILAAGQELSEQLGSQAAAAPAATAAAAAATATATAPTEGEQHGAHRRRALPQPAEAARPEAEPNLWDLLLFIVDGAFPAAEKWPSRVYLADRLATGAASERRRELV